MNRTLAGWTAAIVMGSATWASAGQAPGGDPRVEVGLALAASGGEPRGSGTFSPSLRLNIDAQNGLDVSVDRDLGSRASFYSDAISVSYRRALHRFSHGDIVGTVGLTRTELYDHYVNPYSYPGRVFEFTRFEHHNFVTTGVEVNFQVAPLLIIQSGIRFGVTNEVFSVRVSTGVAVPIGVPVAQEPRGIAPSDERLAGIRRGQTIWVLTHDGPELRGEALSVSDTQLSMLRGGGLTTIALTDVRRIETTDHVRDGAIIGLVAGASGGGLVGALVCECDEYTIFGALAGAAMGGGIGVMAGVIGDSLHEGRRLVYSPRSPAPHLTMGPIAGKSRLGVGGVLRW